MTATQRIVIVGIVILGAAIVLQARTGAGSGAHRFGACDIFNIVQRLLESDRYAPSRRAKEDQIKGELQPLIDELRASESELGAADPKDEKTQARYGAYREKRQHLSQRQQELSAELQSVRTSQFIEAYELVRTAVNTVAARDGITHVFASRSREERLPAVEEPARIAEGVLSRPLLVWPREDDITAAVAAELKLE